MTERRSRIIRAGSLLLASVSIVLGACTKDDAMDFCKNHYRFHADHLDSLGTLVVELSTDGLLLTDVKLPVASLADSPDNVPERLELIERILHDTSRVYRLETERDCDLATVAVSRSPDSVEARYESNCGTDNKVGQLNVTLFNAVPEIEEFDVVVTTPAVRKHFAINRQCSNAIFRLKQQ